MNRARLQRLGLRQYIEITLTNLADCYAHQKPGATDDDFLKEIFVPVYHRDDAKIEEPGDILMLFAPEKDKAKGPDWLMKSPYGAIIVSCAYCVRSEAAAGQGDLELAWSYMVEARYWAGVSMSSMGIEAARKRTIISTTEKASAAALSSKGRAGADARGKMFEPVREYVYNLVREKRPASGWRSRSHAVQSIQAAALKWSTDNPPKLKADGISRTLDGWLKVMPDAASLFPPKGKKAGAGSDEATGKN